MSWLRWSLLLAGLWIGLTGTLSPANALLGWLVGLGATGLALRAHPVDSPDLRPLRALAFAGFYAWEVLLSSLRVARDVLDPRLRARPAVVAVPLDEHTDEELLTLVNLLTFTPGTLALDLSSDGGILYVHAMNARDVDQLRETIKAFERRVRRLFG